MKILILKNLCINITLIIIILSSSHVIAQDKEYSLLSIIQDYDLIQIKVTPSLEDFFLKKNSFSLNYNKCFFVIYVGISPENEVYIRKIDNGCSSDEGLNDKILNDLQKLKFTVVRRTGKTINYNLNAGLTIRFKDGKEVYYCCSDKVIKDWIGK